MKNFVRNKKARRQNRLYVLRIRRDADDLAAIEICYNHAEKGTISEAAQALSIVQPSLTNAIKKLEMELDVSIFKRTNKGVVLSQEGEEFLAYARCESTYMCQFGKPAGTKTHRDAGGFGAISLSVL